MHNLLKIAKYIPKHHFHKQKHKNHLNQKWLIHQGYLKMAFLSLLFLIGDFCSWNKPSKLTTSKDHWWLQQPPYLSHLISNCSFCYQENWFDCFSQSQHIFPIIGAYLNLNSEGKRPQKSGEKINFILQIDRAQSFNSLMEDFHL